MTGRLDARTRGWARAMLWVALAVTLAGAAVAGVRLQASLMDMVLLQLAFYGAWAALAGGYAGALLGAAVEEDACGELDMGVTSSMGAFLGAVVVSLVVDALVGLGLTRPWWWVWIGVVALTLLLVPLDRYADRLVRNRVVASPGRRKSAPGEPPPLRMRDRLTILVTASVVVMLALTAYMALDMGRNIGDAIMLAPMMYAMTGGMIGGIAGGWIGGLRDEHRGAPEHDSTVMVAAMGLMSAMMGAMPAGMTAGMLAVMGERSVAVTAGSGFALAIVSVIVVLRGRGALAPGDPAAPRDQPHSESKEIPMKPSDSSSVAATDEHLLELEVRGMTCGHCAMHVSKCLRGLPGVRAVEVDHASGRVELRHADDFVGLAKAGQALAAIGYELVTERAP